MAIEHDSFIGLWSLYSGPLYSELLLQADNNYMHSFENGFRSHWGQWSLREQNGDTLLWLELKGARPQSYFGPNGPVQITWPPYEAWAVTDVQPNQINFYDMIMVRKTFTPQQQPVMNMQPLANTPPPSLGGPSPQGQKPPNQQTQTTNSSNVSSEMPQTTLPSTNYSAPQQGPPPDSHTNEIIGQWVDWDNDRRKKQMELTERGLEISHGFAEKYKDFAGS